ncbi:glutathione S-transferase [Roseovarius sp. CAU 1744]|uniref:glutathione S-transferase n=1 Tax=Roseovarius sp. CAU 1744 TaxID=3140368 RepID=UPI00325B2EDF
MRPILWSFRRCPYAMRARLALAAAGAQVELREVILRDKPQAFLETSPTATVPCLDTGEEIIDESLDIMLWALRNNDPERWLEMPPQGHDLIDENDGPFKTALDRYKYASRHPEADSEAERGNASAFLMQLDGLLRGRAFLFGSRVSLADMAILPFVRQFAHVDLDWFSDQPWPEARRWLEAFKSSQSFTAIMKKYPQWHPGAPGIAFP